MTTTLAGVAGQIRRGTRAELTRVGGARSILLYGLIPGAVLLPLVITLGVATVAERFASISGSIQVTSVTTTNSVYWVITFTVMIWAVVAAYAQTTAERGALGELARHLYPRRWTGLVSRWIAYGVGAALCSAALVALVMAILPTFFPKVYSGVDIGSPEGLRFLIAVPVFAVFTVGIGIGLAAIIGHPAGTVVALLGWTYVIENAISLVPDGYTLQQYMPFLNGTFGTGQELAFMPPWGPTGGLLYCGAVAVALFVLGCVSLTFRVRRTGSRAPSSAVRAVLAGRRAAPPS
ncbi:ABC transporter permease [Gordonia alkanivorans]|uniref:ABC transporter permease n=1 Tax=Gordonia alkanivorans TaxID=84096 RepID=UPI00244C1BE3|nr:ABC transporter permease [Gordonia alkanivorans]MDH3047092.1 ABC transporter permease [Gordonia alkanivorans]